MAANRCGRCSMNSPAIVAKRRSLERSRVRHHRRQTARRAGIARPHQPLAAGARHLGAERGAGRARPRICGCSDRRSVAACWPAKRWPRAMLGEGNGDPQRYVTLARFFRRKHLGSGSRVGAHRDGQRRRRQRRRRGAAGVALWGAPSETDSAKYGATRSRQTRCAFPKCDPAYRCRSCGLQL